MHIFFIVPNENLKIIKNYGKVNKFRYGNYWNFVYSDVLQRSWENPSDVFLKLERMESKWSYDWKAKVITLIIDLPDGKLVFGRALWTTSFLPLLRRVT